MTHTQPRAQLFERALNLQSVARGLSPFIEGDLAVYLTRIARSTIPEGEQMLSSWLQFAETVLLSAREQLELDALLTRARQLQRDSLRIRTYEVTWEARPWLEELTDNYGRFPKEPPLLHSWVNAAEQLLEKLQEMQRQSQIAQAKYEEEKDRELAQRLSADREYAEEAIATLKSGGFIDWCWSTFVYVTSDIENELDPQDLERLRRASMTNERAMERAEERRNMYWTLEDRYGDFTRNSKYFKRLARERSQRTYERAEHHRNSVHNYRSSVEFLADRGMELKGWALKYKVQRLKRDNRRTWRRQVRKLRREQENS